jgi:hypothetical protein
MDKNIAAALVFFPHLLCIIAIVPIGIAFLIKRKNK